MRREEFMTELAFLLQDISEEERMEAMQYYNDYFEDAGEDQEEKIVAQLGHPAKVAAEVKMGLRDQEEEAAEYRETGYTDTRFEYREAPAKCEENVKDFKDRKYDYSYGGTYTETTVSDESKPWTNKTLKTILIILVIIAAVPVLGPILIGIVSAIFGIVVSIIAVVTSLVIASIAVAIAGFAVTAAGIISFFTNLASGLLVIGIGLILTVLGLIATVASVKLCVVVFPGIIRGIVFLGRKLFRKEKAVA